MTLPTLCFHWFVLCSCRHFAKLSWKGSNYLFSPQTKQSIHLLKLSFSLLTVLPHRTFIHSFPSYEKLAFLPLAQWRSMILSWYFFNDMKIVYLFPVRYHQISLEVVNCNFRVFLPKEVFVFPSDHLHVLNAFRVRNTARVQENWVVSPRWSVKMVSAYNCPCCS